MAEASVASEQLHGIGEKTSDTDREVYKFLRVARSGDYVLPGSTSASQKHAMGAGRRSWQNDTSATGTAQSGTGTALPRYRWRLPTSTTRTKVKEVVESAFSPRGKIDRIEAYYVFPAGGDDAGVRTRSNVKADGETLIDGVARGRIGS